MQLIAVSIFIIAVCIGAAYYMCLLERARSEALLNQVHDILEDHAASMRRLWDELDVVASEGQPPKKNGSTAILTKNS